MKFNVPQKLQPEPLDTGRKLNVHKTFRRRPGRLLNVLCMFNLCLVSGGRCGSGFYSFLSIFYEYHNKEYSLTKLEQF